MTVKDKQFLDWLDSFHKSYKRATPLSKEEVLSLQSRILQGEGNAKKEFLEGFRRTIYEKSDLISESQGLPIIPLLEAGESASEEGIEDYQEEDGPLDEYLSSCLDEALEDASNELKEELTSDEANLVKGKGILLTQQEEKALASRIAKGQQKDALKEEKEDALLARNALVVANLPLVAYLVNNSLKQLDIKLSDQIVEDLLQEGNIGLTRAAEKYDPALGSKFSTYASFWVKDAVRRAIFASGSISIPIGLRSKRAKLLAMKAQLEEEWGKEVLLGELAHASGLSIREVVFLMTLPTYVSSLDSPLGEEEEDSEEDTIASEENADSLLELDEKQALLLKGLKHLNDREKIVITNLFGLSGGKEKSLEEVGRLLGISGERVRQIREMALYKMRKAMEEDE